MLPWKALRAQAWKGKEISTQGIRLVLDQELGILQPEADPYFQAFLALNYAFLVGTQLHAPEHRKSPPIEKALISFRSVSSVSGLKLFQLSTFSFLN